MKNVGISLLVIFLIFNNIIFNLIKFPEYFSYWDEMAFLIVSLLFLLKIVSCKNYVFSKTNMRILLCFIAITVVGIIGNIKYEYASSIEAIVRDIVGFAKFPVTYIILRELKYDERIAKCIKKYILVFIKIMTIIIFTLGIVSLRYDIGLSQSGIRYGFSPYQFLFSHPTYLVLVCVYMLAVLAASEKKNENLLFYIMLVATIMLSARSKGFAIAGVFVLFRYLGRFLNKHRYIMLIAVVAMSIILGYGRLEQYANYTESARAALYSGSFQLMRECFPVGSGFATFASHLSADLSTRSKVYDFIYIPAAFANGEASAVVGDTGYPYYIGQFGLIGVIIFAAMLFFIYKSISKKGVAAQVVFFYILISLTSETTLLNFGFELAVILAAVEKIYSRKVINNEIIATKKIFSNSLTKYGVGMTHFYTGGKNDYNSKKVTKQGTSINECPGKPCKNCP